MNQATAEQVLSEWAYQNDRAIIMPYVASLASTEAFPEDFLSKLYWRTKNERLQRRTFPGVEKFSLNWFIQYFYSRSMVIGIVKPGKIAGYAWMYDVEGSKFKKGAVGVCFYREFWGNTVLRDLANFGLEWFFKEAGFYTIYGTVASWNLVSMRFGKLLGFEPCGRLPRFFLQGETFADNHLFALKREDFLGRER